MPTILTPNVGLTRIRASGLAARQLQHIDENFDIVDGAVGALRPVAPLVTEAVPRWSVNGHEAPTSGTLKLTAIKLPVGMVVTNLIHWSGSTAMVSPTNQWFGLFDASFNRLALTNDDTNGAWSTFQGKALALTSPYTVPRSDVYYIGVLIAAATPISLQGTSSFNSNNILNGGNTAGVTVAVPKLQGNSSTGLTTPASCPATVTAPTGNLQMNWCAAS